MLDNERLIYKMLLEQKLRLVTSAVLYKSSPVGAYEFPVVRFAEKPFQGKDVVLTQFPSDCTLASSWDTELVEKVFAYAGNEARSRDVYDGYYSCNDPKTQNIASAHYLSAQYLAARNRGANGKQPTAHEIVPASFGEELLRKNLTDTVLDEGAPDVVIAECVEDAEVYLKNQEFHGLVYGIAASPEEAARYFFAGCSFVYLKEDFFSELLSFFDLRTKNYRVAFGEYKEKKLSLKELDRRARVLDIFDEGLIDNACDRTINFLKKQKGAEIKISEKPTAAEQRLMKSEEEEHLRLARRAARESAVLLKNENRFLPLKRGMRVALIGEYLENFDYQRETFSAKPTKTRTPIEIAKDYETLNVTGYAAGYRRGEGVNEELVSNAARLASSSDCAAVFLTADPKKNELPENQILLLKALVGWNIKVVAVISADRCIDTDFAKGCQAVLFTGRGGQEAASAAFDLITGECSPSGKLTYPVEGSRGYPFGYGLTYTKFEYRDLEINESGVSVIVENKGDFDASAVVQLYLQKGGSMYADKTLKGFGKEFIKKGDAVRVTIPFTENTFRYYDAEKKKYRTQGGEYKLYISESAAADKLTGVVRIAADDGSTFTNTLSEASADGKNIAFSESRGLNERKGMSFGMKLFLALSLFVYFTATAALLLFADFIPVDRTDLFYALVGSITGVIDILLVVYIAVISAKRQKPFISANETLTDMVERVEEFVEIAKLTYPDPVKEKEKKAWEEEEKIKAEEEKKEQEQAEREKREAEKAEAEKKQEKEKEENKRTEEKASASEAASPSLDKPGDYPEAESFESMCLAFRRYVMGCGINLGAGSARRLLAAIAASRLVLITSKNSELLPEFMTAVNHYFGGKGVSVAGGGWNVSEDLLWQENAGRNTYSPFTNAVIDATKRHNKNAVALIGNVSSDNLADWFADFVSFALSPTEKHRITLNKDTKITLSSNLCSLLFAKENGFETALPREVLNASLIIDVSIRKADDADVGERAESAASYPNFCALVREAREKYFLSEKNWVKLDGLFEFAAAGEPLSFGNKNTLMAEKFTSVLMACGAEESEALTSLLRFKVIPFLKTTRMYAQEDGITVLSDYLQKAFPDEDLTKVKKVLADRPKQAREKEQREFFTPDYKGVTENAGFTAASEPIYAEPPKTEETVSEPIYAEPPKTEETVSEPIYAEPSKTEETVSEPIYAEPSQTEETAYYSESNYSDGGVYGNMPTEENQSASAYRDGGADNYDGAYQSGTENYQNVYDGNFYDQNAYDQNAYGGYDGVYPQNGYDGYENVADQNYQNGNGYEGYDNYQTDSWSDTENGGGEK